jgi:YbbR domain-containing protein
VIFDARRVNVPILLLSFALSLLLWMHVKSLSAQNGPQGGPSTFTVELTLRNQPAGMVVVGEVPSVVTFTAFGPVEEQQKINANYLKAFVDLAEKPRDGRYLVRLETTSDYKVEWRPTDLRIPIQLEPQITKRVNVEVEAIGDFRLQDYRYDGATSDPTTITVTGGSSLVAKVKRARAYLNLASLEENNTQRAKIEILDDKDAPVTGVTTSTDTVTVRAFIAPRPPRRSLLIQPVWAGTPEFGSTIADYEFTPAQVNVEGPADVLANLSIIQTKPINIDGLNQTSTIQVELDLPQGIRLTKPEVVSIKVFVKKSGPPTDGATGG